MTNDSLDLKNMSNDSFDLKRTCQIGCKCKLFVMSMKIFELVALFTTKGS